MKNKIIAPILLALSIPVFLNSAVWPSFRHDTLGTGISPYHGPIQCNIVCSHDIEWSKSSPVIDDNEHVYIQGEEPGTSNWKLWCLNTSDCSVAWTYLLGTTEPSGNLYSSCAIAPDNTIYLGYLNALYALNADGSYKWKYPTGGAVLSSPAIGSDGTIYVGCADNSLYAINPDSTLKWSFPANGGLTSSPAIGSDGTIYVGSTGNRLYAINPNGTLKWTYPTGGSVESSPAIGSDGTIYVGSWDNYFYAIKSDGTLKWSFKTSGIVRSSPAVDDARGMVYIGSDSTGRGYLNALDTAGILQWRTRLLGNGARYSSPSIASMNNIIYIGDLSGGFWEIDGATGDTICHNQHTYMITTPAIDKEKNGKWCVWYNEYSEKLRKVCYTDLFEIEENCNCNRREPVLSQNQPNPFVTNTNISFFLPAKTNISLKLYDITGRTITTLATGEYANGKHTVGWSARDTKEGIYFCELKAGHRTLVRKMVLIR